MKLKFLLTGLACLSFMGGVKSQDLIKQIPADAGLMAAFNIKEIVQKANADKLNQLLQKAGLFKQIEKSGATVGQDIKNLGIDLSQNAYFYTRNTDSVDFYEFIFPLADKTQFEKLLLDAGEPRPFANGYTRVGMKPGSMLIYNDRIARFISASVESTFFENDSVASRYGIKKVTYMPPAADYGEVDSAAVLVDSTAVIIEEGEKMLEVPTPPVLESAEPDTIVTDMEEMAADAAAEAVEMHDPAYYDSLYTDYEDQNRRNDSIRNALRDEWLEAEATRLLSGTFTPLSMADQHKVVKDLGLIRLYVPRVEELYRGLLSYKTIPYLYMGVDMEKFRTGYQDGVLDLLQDGNVLKLRGSIGLDRELAKMCKRLYAQKPNRRFSKYLTDKTLGFFNFNMNSEAYLREMPTYAAKYYGGLLGAKKDIVEWGMLALQIALDEKAIAQVMPGDHLVVVNGLRKFRREYIDYSYDEDYNATEVKKTKEETLPVFIWMFTSKDQRLFKRGLDMAVTKSIGRIEDGIYAFAAKKAVDFPMYVLLKDDLVMVSNDSLSLHDIHHNKMAAVPNKEFIKLMKQNKMAAAFDLQKLPAMLKEMGVNPGRQLQQTMEQLNQYGSTAITSKGIVANRMEAEMSTKLPQTKDGAISYLIDQILLEIGRN